MAGDVKMAELEFGDSKLFVQLEEEEDAAPQAVHVRFDQTDDCEMTAGSFQEQLACCEETISQLRAENQELRRRLAVLSRPSGLSVNDKFDGPLLQILFMNHVISKQYHPEIEDFLSSLIQKHEEEKNTNSEQTTFNIKPQPSSISLESNDISISSVKAIKEAFNVVGSVLYFTNFCLDKLGQPLLNENPQLTDGWEIPKYQQVFSQILSLDGQEVQVQVKSKRPKPCCFNCGSEEHQLKDCPKPRDFVHIGMKRKEFLDSCAESANQNYQQRYHVEEVAERFGKFKPGIIGEELQEALGISDRHLPPFIYRMRELGYPPGWLKDAELENSGLSLYDGKDSSDGEIVEEALPKKSYDLSKLISYPGFNTSPPTGVSDDWRNFGSIPMQADHHKEVFANYLSFSFPDPKDNAAQKRSSSSQSSLDKKRQKTPGNSQGQSPVDMDVASDFDASYCSPSQGFKFQPPLPPGSPYHTPPPLPRGTPPSTPPNFIPPPPPTPTPPPLPKGTPPPTPSRGSPFLQSRDSFPSQSKALDSMDEDILTLEELEEQQRLIWAALENTGESTNSDSDIHTPLTGNSVTSSPSRAEMDNVADGKMTCQNIKGSKHSDLAIKSVRQESDKNVLMTIEDVQDVTVPSDTIDESKTICVVTEDITEEATCVDASSTRIPDRSKFAEGITPFEFDNMSESTGVYLRLRDVLKNSPRNQQKIKKGM